MGSDLSMSPPTPDEYRIVRCGDATALYSRHTDGIYGDTKTWHRQTLVEEDHDGQVLQFAQNTHKGVKTTTLHYSVYLGETLDSETMAETDRDWDHEIAVLRSQITRAREQAEFYSNEAARLERELHDLAMERREERTVST